MQLIVDSSIHSNVSLPEREKRGCRLIKICGTHLKMSNLDGCDRFQRALMECHRKIPAGSAREAACKHLNRALAQCLVSLACPDESEAVRSLCSSGGTGLKRTQCQQAQLSLSLCLSSLQQQ